MEMAITEGTPLDDIKAEIEELKPHSHYTQKMKDDVLKIIDKHIGKENTNDTISEEIK